MKNKLFFVLILGWGILSVRTSAILRAEPLPANEVYLDRDCQILEDLSQFDKWAVVYQSEFQAVDETYWFYAGQYQDGAVLFCISKPKFSQARVLNEKKLQNQFIEKITKDPNSNSMFMITVRDGNGRNVSLTDYQLDLANLNQPILTRLGETSN
ncbi:MAG: hypothetical protein WBA77_19375 [Microcoleaceae cyanobacterium]